MNIHHELAQPHEVERDIKIMSRRARRAVGVPLDDASTPVLRTERLGVKSIELEVAKTEVDCNADVRGTQKSFDGRDAPKPIPKQAPCARPASEPHASSTCSRASYQGGGVRPLLGSQQEKEDYPEGELSLVGAWRQSHRDEGRHSRCAKTRVRKQRRQGGAARWRERRGRKVADEEVESLQTRIVVEEAHEQRECEEELNKMRAEMERIESEKAEA